MPWTAERTTVNQRVQVGAESTSALGTPVAASKILQAYSFVFGPATDVLFYGATGRKYDLVQEENAEWVDGTVTGFLDYNHAIYPLAGACGSVSAAAHGASATAKDWVFTPPVTGSLVPQTYTFQQGDSTRAHQLAYGLFTKFGYKMSRKDVTVDGAILAQALSDGITMTGSPTAVALSPVPGKQVNVYLDNTSAALGTTQLLRVLSLDYAFDAIYGPLWVLNRANLSYPAHVDMKPKATMKIKLEADAAGMSLLPLLQSGNTQFMRVNAQGPIIDNLQTVTIGGGATGGTFTLGYKGVTTSTITYSAALTSATVNTAFQGLSTVGSNCTVSGSAGGPYIFTFSGALASDMSPVIATNVALSGGTPTITSVAQAYNIFQHDMAVKVGKPSPFGDDQGVFAIEWELMIVEDSGWGKAQTFTATNLLTAL